MDALSQLFSQYSLETIIILIVSLAVAFKFISELVEYFYEKLKAYFNHQSVKDRKHSEIMEGLTNVRQEVSTLSSKINEQSEEIKQLKEHEKLTMERLYEIKAIDDLNLQSLERRYLYYKAAGGNSFIDGLMEEIRELPRINLSNPQIIKTIQSETERSE